MGASVGGWLVTLDGDGVGAAVGGETLGGALEAAAVGGATVGVGGEVGGATVVGATVGVGGGVGRGTLGTGDEMGGMVGAGPPLVSAPATTAPPTTPKPRTRAAATAIIPVGSRRAGGPVHGAGAWIGAPAH